MNYDSDQLLEAIQCEVILNIYDKWQPRKYFSSKKGLISISDMSEKHILNTITSLKKTRLQRLENINKLSDSIDVDLWIKKIFNDELDLMSLKIKELVSELNTRGIEYEL